jgi:hypothetical protein
MPIYAFLASYLINLLPSWLNLSRPGITASVATSANVSLQLNRGNDGIEHECHENGRVKHGIPSFRLAALQCAAIRLAAIIGDDIQENYPDIAMEYRSGVTAPQLVVAYEFDRRYGANRACSPSVLERLGHPRTKLRLVYLN